MSDVMMGLGDYRFSLPTAAYQRLARSTEYGWTKQARLGRDVAWQKLHGRDETMTLDGVIYPHYKGGLGQVEAMRTEALKGTPLDLVDGHGRNWDEWVILKIAETRSEFFADGAPKKQEFSLELAKYGEDTA